MRTLILGGAGYIGSELADYIPGADVVDLGWFGPSPDRRDYNSLTADELQAYDAVILLAGHSSVKMCWEGGYSSYRNNVRNFLNLTGKLSKKQRFIYASSSSVYGQAAGHACETDPTQARGEYDRQKAMVDDIAGRSGLDYYGLRFGTVCGYSRNLRTDLMVNAMVASAVEDKVVKVSFPETRRPILWINDLCRAVAAILAADPWKNRGLYNVVSENSTAGDIGRIVSECYNVPLALTDRAGDGTKLRSSDYNFYLSGIKFWDRFDFEPAGTIKGIALELGYRWRDVQVFGKRDTNKVYDDEMRDLRKP